MLTDIIANAVMKKHASTRSGLFRPNSAQRSETLTLAVSFSSITTLSRVCEKQKNRNASPTREYTSIVRNQARPSAGMACSPTICEPFAKLLTRAGIPMDTARPPRFAMNMRDDGRTVISSVSRVSEALRAPYGTLTSV